MHFTGLACTKFSNNNNKKNPAKIKCIAKFSYLKVFLKERNKFLNAWCPTGGGEDMTHA